MGGGHEPKDRPARLADGALGPPWPSPNRRAHAAAARTPVETQQANVDLQDIVQHKTRDGGGDMRR
jgi:hypothetical protein